LTVGLYSGGTLAYDLRNLTAQPLARPSLHSAAVRAFAFHGERVVSASDDGTVRFSDNDSKIQHADFVRGLAVVGIQLVSASWDKTLRFTPL
jgi:WD40 repeat protein